MPPPDQITTQPRTLDEALADYEGRQTAKQNERDNLRAELSISEEIDRKERERLALHESHQGIAFHAIRGAALALAELPQAFADLSEVGPKLTLGSGFDVLNDSARVVSKTAKRVLEATPEPTNTGQSLAESIGRFVSAFAPAERVIGSASWLTKFGSLGKFAGTSTAGAVADFAVFDPAQGNLSALVQEHPALANPVSEFLATDPKGSNATNRLRNTVEGLGLGAGVEGLLAGLRVLRSVRAAKAATETEAAGRAAAADVRVPEPDAPAVEPRASTEPTSSEPKASTEPTPSEPKAASEAPAAPIEPAATAATPPRSVPTIQVSPEVAEQVAARVARGELSQAAQLVDFNSATIDWQSFGDNADDVRQLINTVSEQFEPMIDAAKGGVQTLKETARLAELVGGNVEQVSTLFSDVRGDSGIAARMMAAEKVMLASAQRLRTLARRVVDDGSNEARVELLRHIEAHAAIQAQVKGSKTEIARALHAMRSLKQAAAVNFESFTDVARTLGNDPLSGDLAKKLAGMGNLRELNEAARKASGRRWHSYALEVWINGLLSGPVTHAANFASNTAKAVLAVPERAIAAGIGGVRRGALRQTSETVRAGEVVQTAFGLVRGLSDALKLPGAATLRQLGTAAVQGVRAWDSTAVRDLIEANKQEFGNVYRSIAEGGSVIDAASKVESDTQAALRWDVGDRQGASRAAVQAANMLGQVVRLPGEALAASDELFKSIAYRQELNALALRRATEEAEHAGLTGQAKADAVSKRYGEVLANPPEELHLGAVDFAKHQTFTQQLGETGRAVQGLLARVPLLRFVVPFVRTPANLLKDFVSHTPLPLTKLVQKEFRRKLAAGGAEADLALARMTLGTGAMAGVWELAESGLIRGGGIEGRDTGELSGIKPYSIKLGESRYSFNRLEPIGQLFGAVADLHDITERRYEADGENTELQDLAKLIAMAAAKNVSSKTWLVGVSSLSLAASDPERYGDKYMQHFAASLVPFSSALRGAAAESDPFSREVFTFADQLRANTPGLSTSLPVRRDYLGRPVEHGKPWLSPIAVSEASKDPLDRELSRLAFPFEMPAKALRGVPLTAAQYSELVRIRGQQKFNGRSLEDTLRGLIASDAYSRLSDDSDPTVLGTKVDAVKRVVSAYGQAAQLALQQRDEALRDRVQAEQVRRRTSALMK